MDNGCDIIALGLLEKIPFLDNCLPGTLNLNTLIIHEKKDFGQTVY